MAGGGGGSECDIMTKHHQPRVAKSSRCTEVLHRDDLMFTEVICPFRVLGSSAHCAVPAASANPPISEIAQVLSQEMLRLA
jgi:hypothetical protein